MQVFPYQWNYIDEYQKTIIRIFGLSNKNESVFIEIEDFLPYIYIELPVSPWNIGTVKMVENRLKFLSNNTIMRVEYEVKKKLYFAKMNVDDKGNYKDKKYMIVLKKN